jgi:hypothetical protein
MENDLEGPRLPKELARLETEERARPVLVGRAVGGRSGSSSVDG